MTVPILHKVVYITDKCYICNIMCIIIWLNCTLLLDSASRFGLFEGGYNVPCDAKINYS